MRRIINIILFCLLSCVSITINAQRPTVRATIQPSDILIGQQATINVEVISPKGHNIVFPIYADTIIKGVEVLKMLPPDTIMTEVMKINQKYIVTSFDSTLYHIPQIPVIDGSDTIFSNDLGLKVSAPQLSDTTLAYLELLKNNQTDSIDFNQLQISDIKDIQESPLVWTDYLDYLLKWLLIPIIMAIIGILVYLIMKKKKIGYYFKPKPEVPPHVEALKGLDKLKSSKLWQKGKEKEYFTELTDILRKYIERRFNIEAPEMTTDEIISAVNLATDTKSATDSLSQILTLADLVKFAKYIPLNDENDLSLVNAYLFVNQTKVEERPSIENQKEDIKKQ